MAKTFLLEIGLEEMPARFVTSSIKQFKAAMEKFLKENRLSYSEVRTYSTPRRLTLEVLELAEKQEDIEEEAKGPAKKIAVDAEGNWTKAAEGFARGQGVSTDKLFFKDIKGVEYVHVDKFIPGESAQAVLANVLETLKGIHFPVTMHWGNHTTEFIRPIHWIISLLDDELIDLQFLDVKSGKTTRGHRFLGQETTINHPSEYVEKLKAQHVLVNAEERKALIVKQIEALAAENNWVMNLDEVLLEEVNNIVEYPTAFAGKFDEKYLAVPEEVLIISMKEHQRYFEVRFQDGKLAPFFVAVRNGNEAFIQNVVAGNEKVLVARLEDAVFFYDEDQQPTIASYVERLKKVTFHEKIGTTYEKMQRVAKISEILGQAVGLSNEEQADLARAAAIYKFDLMTGMVGEFPELQGIMGEKYALLKGEKPAVAQAIREHYLPVSSEGELPESSVGAVLAIADKLDSVMTFFNAGMIPSGSNDPYALRRQTYGIVRIIEDKGWDLAISKLLPIIKEAINQNVETYGVTFKEDPEAVVEFFNARLKQLLSGKNIRHDIIEASVNAQAADMNQIIEVASLLQEKQTTEQFRPTMEAFIRVLNLTRKGQELIGDTLTEAVDDDLFETAEEKELAHAVTTAQATFADLTFAQKYEQLTELTPFITNYFDHTMIMADNEEVRNNRLRQLAKIAAMILPMAKIDLLEIKK
ncbi:glycine--tRNA ligase subunit beta [Vagococcus xieshaowenii]|uniref:Glycine--tRNA ligase beta subunit n=1 Tax=Vagococcus xieshaowenii TaxID=2562451 RepID=A0AAJ5JMV4_9ENTE|nr:glycine--tRNA ligase subunit beta [Vagococcus xieshaowenii]QCA28829.1 glycine--tRNA ligase subunit beta [Vagococcus xieshaowenii]TFZ43464.1 glycine--tRNA ligase subunit beta [Vagococcus xieshaowenii]